LNSFFHLELQITPLDSPIVLFPDISLWMLPPSSPSDHLWLTFFIHLIL
jgi:hypothetical protein